MMAIKLSSLWNAPEINVVNHKARSIPALNPLNVYGRVFLLSWWGFFIAFWSWYAFPPLLVSTIRQDLGLTQNDVANSNLIALVASFLVRLGAGSACDRFGPRWTFATILLVGAIPTALAGTVTTPNGLIAIRFFVGILGGSFVPCQVWTTAFYDKNIVGTANSLTAGLGNAGSGVTYFIMPAIFDSLVNRQHLSQHVAWRVAFIIPFILISFSALIMILTCPDTPTGSWSSRSRDLQRHHEMRDTFLSTTGERKNHQTSSISSGVAGNDSYGHDTIGLKLSQGQGQFHESAQQNEDELLAAASWELVEKPTYHGTAKALTSLSTLTLLTGYFSSFGAELSINSYLAAYYSKNFPSLGQTGAGNWAAMFGLFNVIFRPTGGVISDVTYGYTHSLWAKKLWMHGFAIMMAVFLIVIGFTDPMDKSTMFGLVVGLAFFVEASNGALFALVPHVHPTSNGNNPHPPDSECQSELTGTSRPYYWYDRCKRRSRWDRVPVNCSL